MILPAHAAGSSPRRRACLRAARHGRRPTPATALHRTRPTPPARTTPAGRLFLWLAAAPTTALPRAERVHALAAGVAVAGTAVLATVSMTAALTIAVRIPLAGAIALALVWGLLIGSVDRVIVASAARSAGAVAVRLLLAVVLGVIVAEPLVLRIFEPEINAELAAGATRDAATARQDAEQLVTADRAQLEQDRARLETAVADAERAVTAADQAYAAEVSGEAGTGRSGVGPAAARHLADGRAARERLAAAKDAYAAGTARLDREAVALEATVGAETDRRAAAARDRDGLLARHEALHALIGRSSAMALAAAAVAWLLILVEVMPALLAALRPAGVLETRERAAAVVERARIESDRRVTLAEIAAAERAQLALLRADSPEHSPQHSPADSPHSPEHSSAAHPVDQQEDSPHSAEHSPEHSPDSPEHSPVLTVREALEAAYATPPPPGRRGWTSRPFADRASELLGRPVSQSSANEFLKPRRSRTSQ